MPRGTYGRKEESLAWQDILYDSSGGGSGDDDDDDKGRNASLIPPPILYLFHLHATVVRMAVSKDINGGWELFILLKSYNDTKVI